LLNKIEKMDYLRTLYYEMTIIPSEQDFLQKANNTDWMYLVLYWVNKEHLYPLFVEEEMDYETMLMMNEHDLRYFHLDRYEPFVSWLAYIGS